MHDRPAPGPPLRARALLAGAALLLGACAAAPAPTSGGPSAPPAAPAAPAAAPAQKPPRAALPRLAPTAPPADLAVEERFAWQRAVEFGQAFSAGDTAGFMDKISRGFYRGYAALESALKSLVADSTARAAVVAVRKVSSEEGRVSVTAQWTSSVTLRDGSVREAAGQTVFLFLKSDTSLRLLDYRGDAPFGIPGI